MKKSNEPKQERFLDCPGLTMAFRECQNVVITLVIHSKDMRDRTCLIITTQKQQQQLTFNEHLLCSRPCSQCSFTHSLTKCYSNSSTSQNNPEIGPAKPRDSTISQGQMAREVAESKVQPRQPNSYHHTKMLCRKVYLKEQFTHFFAQSVSSI